MVKWASFGCWLLIGRELVASDWSRGCHSNRRWETADRIERSRAQGTRSHVVWAEVTGNGKDDTVTGRDVTGTGRVVAGSEVMATGSHVVWGGKLRTGREKGSRA